MAISPQEARQQQIQKLTPALISWEAEIDAGLSRGKRTFMVVGTDRHELIPEILKRFNAAGWAIHRRSDRNEIYLEFSPRSVDRGVPYRD
jgi:allophanate hydrolase subunit 2